MKKAILLLTVLFLYGTMYSQCPQGDIVLTTQQEVDDFAVNYPNCTEISGNLTVHNVNDLSPLNQLNTVNGYLRIENSDVENFSGLENITQIGGNFIIRSCTSLNSFTGLESLTHIGGGLLVGGQYSTVSEHPNCFVSHILTGCPGLTNFEGLNNLETIDEGLFVIGNLNLQSFEGLTALDSIKGSFFRANNPKLKDFQGLENLKFIGGSIFTGFLKTVASFPQDDDTCNYYCECYDSQGLVDESRFASFNGLSGLEVIAVSLNIIDNDSIVNFEGFESLHTIGGSLAIGEQNVYPFQNSINSSLESFQGLDELQNVDRIFLESNYALGSLVGIDNINHITISNVEMMNNNELDICSVQSICNYLENGGTSEINNNAMGCNSDTEILQNCIALPVEMVSPLQVRLQNRTAILTWRTATETNNSGFEIQRSKDGINWEKIGWQAGQGTTTSPHSYTYRDTNPLSGTSYYRLKQVDFNGQFEYSNIVSLRYDKPEGITVYPIPAKEVIIFDVPNIAAADDIILYDIMGKQISRQAFPQDKRLVVSHLNDGVYIYRIFYEEEVYSGKIVLE